MPKQIALDGPSASGKSTVGVMLAARLGWDFLDTGLMYRAVTLIAIRDCVSLEDVDAVAGIAEALKFEVCKRDEGEWRLIVDGEDLTDALHTERINRDVSPVSAIPAVRRTLVRQQRSLADQGPIVMAGRDIGTVVLGDAPLKIFLVTSAEIRAQRRVEDEDGNIDGHEYEQVLRSLQRRDEIDSTRIDSPLRPAEDAKIIDNSEATAEEVVKKIMSMIEFSDASQLNARHTGAKVA
jgi:cytidylate kinase